MAYKVETVANCRYEINEVDHTDKVCELVNVERTACPTGCCVVGSDPEFTSPHADPDASPDADNYGEVRPMYEIFEDFYCFRNDPHNCEDDDTCTAWDSTFRWCPKLIAETEAVAKIIEEEFFELVREMVADAPRPAARRVPPRGTGRRRYPCGRSHRR